MSPDQAQSVTSELRFAPFSYARARALARELDLAEPVAVALVRRGYDSVAAARAFLAADEAHDPGEFDGMEAAVAAIRRAKASGELITVHGDYDVDGVTSTAILVAALRELGAECDWLIPARVEDGYGLTEATLERLAGRGTQLLVTADCGITSAREVTAARELGIEVVVTDHHQPGEELPDCPIVHPLAGGYPCPDLCAAGVAHKVVAALSGAERAERDLDLVALATVADMVPLLGENRSLVRRGLEQARRARRPGLRALMAAAQVVPERLDERDLGFRLAPRINAAGRLYRADAAVELVLTDDPDRAGEIAAELDRANHERRRTEGEVLADAERQLRELGREGADASAIVLWGEGWHPGVVGICASRLVERHGKPAVLIAVDEQGRGKGSGRGVPGFDLLAALHASRELLARFGGHRAAAGLEIETENLDRFRQALWAHVAAHLDPTEAAATTVDAVVGGESLGHRAATQFAALGPFGKGNPEIRLLVPGAHLTGVRPMGEGDRHARFTLVSGAARSAGVAFGVDSSLAAAEEAGPADVSLRLELNEWNGAVSPRVVLDRVHGPGDGVGRDWSCRPDEFARRLDAGLRQAPGAAPAVGLGPARERVERGNDSAIACVAALASSREPVLVVCADALWRRGLVEAAVPPARFGGGEAALVASRGSFRAGVAAAARLLASERGGVALADWPALELDPGLARDFTHVVLADPPPNPALEAAVSSGIAGDGGFVHVLGSHADPALTLRALELAVPLRDALAGAFRSLRRLQTGAGLDAEAIRAALCGDSGDARSPEWCARVLRILAEIRVVRIAAGDSGPSLEVVSSVRGDLELSATYAANREAHEECVRFLTEGRQPSSSRMPRAA